LAKLAKLATLIFSCATLQTTEARRGAARCKRWKGVTGGMPIKPNNPSPPEPILSPKLERKRIVKSRVAAALRGESTDSVDRHLADKRVQLGPRNYGYRLEDVLQLPPDDAA
jgi:hypothetical protein